MFVFRADHLSGEWYNSDTPSLISPSDLVCFSRSLPLARLLVIRCISHASSGRAQLQRWGGVNKWRPMRGKQTGQGEEQTGQKEKQPEHGGDKAHKRGEQTGQGGEQIRQGGSGPVQQGSGPSLRSGAQSLRGQELSAPVLVHLGAVTELHCLGGRPRALGGLPPLPLPPSSQSCPV